MQNTFLLLAFSAIIRASPVAMPQAVTAFISPSGSAPPGCTPSFSGSFGIAVQNISTKAAVKRAVASGPSQPVAMAPVTMIADGQLQGGMHTMTIVPVVQIPDGQIQAKTTTVAPVTQISDGQIQARTTTAAPITQISDGQIQAKPTTTAAPVTQISDAQPQAPKSTSSAISPRASSASVPSSSVSSRPTFNTTLITSRTTITSITTLPAASSSSIPSPPPTQMVACKTNSTLALTLNNGVLKDALGRTGYIASNYQFQFDGPPQAGALFTSGFSVCGNGSLALGGSNVFWQCLSGNFYNLYDRNWAAQCSPVTINTLNLISCPS